MATNVFMEALSPTMEEGRVAKWHKRDGDAVKAGDVLAEVETDKAVMDLVARADGVLRRVAVAEGQTVPVGSVVAVIAAPGENVSAPSGSPPPVSSGSGMRDAGSVLAVAIPAPATTNAEANNHPDLSGPIFCTGRSERVYIAFAASKLEFSPGRIASGAGGR